MKLFRTSDMSLIKYCQEMFDFELPSITCRDVQTNLKWYIAMLRLC